MNYYDEEIPVNALAAGAATVKPSPPPNNAKVERISSRGSNGDKASALGSGRSVAVVGGNGLQRSMEMVGRPRQRTMVSVAGQGFWPWIIEMFEGSGMQNEDTKWKTAKDILFWNHVDAPWVLQQFSQDIYKGPGPWSFEEFTLVGPEGL